MPKRKAKPKQELDIPEEYLQSFARSIYPKILAFYDSEEGQQAFAEWKEEKARLEKENNR